MRWEGRKSAENPAEKKKLADLPLGTVIAVHLNGQTRTYKKDTLYKKKVPVWVDWSRRIFCEDQDLIAWGYEILKIPDKKCC